MTWILLIVAGIVVLVLAIYLCLVICFIWADLTRTLTEYAEGARHERD